MVPANLSARATPLIDSEDHGEESGVESGDNSRDSDNDSEQSKSSKPKAKRARKSKATDNAPRKKYVRGKQGGLEGIMKMPVEVFTEIACHITPADLINLTRANKFFRSMLLRRVVIQLWQRAQNNVPGLPPCPTGMNEPQYAALMFSKHCTLCGANATSKPDVWLRVRLCASCRDTKLTPAPKFSMEDMYVATSWDIKSRRRHEPAFYIIEEYERASKIRTDLYDKGDLKDLAEWKSTKTAQLKAQKEEAVELKKFIRLADRSREHELKDLKAARQRQVEERLRALGWEEKYLQFRDSPLLREWDSLVGVPKALTERVWANLLPKLTPFLEANRDRTDEQAKQLRRRERHNKVHELAHQLVHDIYPYDAIMTTLDLKPPELHDVFPESTRFLSNPSPSANVITEWDFLVEIYAEENSLERVEELFNQRRSETIERALKWREEFENKLVEDYKLDLDETEQINFAVKIKGSTEGTDGLSLNTRFLLRADTVFVNRSALKLHTSPEDREHGPTLRELHFPWMISRSHRSASGLVSGVFMRHAGVEKIVKALLKDMLMPDATYMEVNMRQNVYSCQRCKSLPFAHWEDLVNHYHARLRQWTGGKFTNNIYTTRHPVVFLDRHSLQPEPDARPLARMVFSDEVQAGKPTDNSKKGHLWCLICSGIYSSTFDEFSSLEVLREHMHDSHVITRELVEGLHYTNRRLNAIGQYACISQWQQKWDEFYDARA